MKMKSFLTACVILYTFQVSVSDKNDTFLYFAYGSNLLARRLLINNPSASFFSIAQLLNHRLDFNIYIKHWNGAVATIVEDTDSAVWGALWELDTKHIASLDKQEGVDSGTYYAKNVTVFTPEGMALQARTYQESVDPPKIPSSHLPILRQPSFTYLQVIIYGAFECGLPMDYIKYLFTFPSNKRLAAWSIREKLGYPFNVTDYNLIKKK